MAAAVRFGVGARLGTPESMFRLVRLVAKTQWLRSRSGMVLLDQGFLQDIWSILLSNGSRPADPSLLSALIASVYQGIDATIVVLAVDPQTASARVAARTDGDSRFDSLPEGQLRDSIEAASGLQRQIIDSARLAGLHVVMIDASPPVEVVTAQLLDLVPSAPARVGDAIPQRPRRISIVGASGSGKTTLARQVADRLGLPFRELDSIREAAEQGSAEQDFQSRVAELALGDSWIIDGHYREVRQLIWSRAELVVWLNYPMRLVFHRVLRRFLGKQRAAASGGDRREMRPKASAQHSASWRRRFERLAKTLRERRLYGRLLQSDYPNVKVVELRSVAATRQWLRDL
ncbi:shikimate kinase [Sphingomonas sp. GCM10030256]|uniref:shikimate kinase n=1 Tax=Sphingomonas sp. GCM10030256 TaxID=3273427 RepID=UPI00361F7F0B